MAKESEWSQFFDSLSIKLENLNNLAEKNDSNEELYNIKKLNLCNCKLIRFPDETSQYLSNIVILNLSDNKISDLPQSISSLTKLEHFILDKNNIQQLPAVISDLESLTELSISQNGLFALLPNMEKLNKLQILNLSNNKLEYLPNSWKKMNNLTTLDISNNLFKLIPNCLREGMSKIQLINVSENKHMNINATIFSNNLKKFYAKNNGSINTTFPKWIFAGKFSVMDELEFEGTQFQGVNIPISEKKVYLKKLNLGQCNLHDTSFQQILINISSLEHLEIGNSYCLSTGNSFSIWPDEYIRQPQSLTTINIRNTGLPDVSKSIERFTNLTEINLEENCMSWLPEEICNLKKLQILNISANILIMLPQNLGSMASLKILNAPHNHISSLPSSITNLKNLELLDLYHNEFIAVPKEIEKLDNLIALDLELNYFSTNDIAMPIYYSDLRNQLRINNTVRFVGTQVIETDSETSSSRSSSSTTSSDEWNDPSDTELINEESHNGNEVRKEENWDRPNDFTDEFDPYNPPPISPPQWEIASVFFDPRFKFCPADFHAQRIRDVIAQARANGDYTTPLPIVEGQFDDAD